MRYYVKQNERFSEVAGRFGLTPGELLARNPGVPRASTLSGCPCVAPEAWKEGLALEIGPVPNGVGAPASDPPVSFEQIWNYVPGTVPTAIASGPGWVPSTWKGNQQYTALYKFTPGYPLANTSPSDVTYVYDNPKIWFVKSQWGWGTVSLDQGLQIVWQSGVYNAPPLTVKPPVVVSAQAPAGKIRVTPGSPVFTGAKPAGVMTKDGMRIFANGVSYAANFSLPPSIWEAASVPASPGSAPMWNIRARVPMSVSFTNSPTVIKIAEGESVLPYVQILAQKGAGGSTGPTGPKGHVIPGQSQGGGPMRLAGISTLGDAPTSLLPLWDLNACTIKLDAAAFDAAGVYDPLKLAQAYGIPLQGPGGLNQAQVGTTMDPATYFQPGAILKMPKAACDMAKAQQAAQNPPAANPPATTTPPDPTHGADPTTPADSTASKGLSTGAMVGIGVAAAAAIGGGYLLLRKKGKGKRK